MKYIKFFISAFVLTGLICTSVFAEEEADTSEITVTLNGEEISFGDVKPMIKDDRTLVPFRAIFEALGAEVGFTQDEDGRVDTVSAEKDGVKVTMVIGDVNYTTEKDGETENAVMSTAPLIENGSTFIPARYGAEAFGYNVEWINETHTVIITEAAENAEGETEPETAEPASEETTVITVEGEYTYTGCVNEAGQPNGKGTKEYDSKDKYEGEFVNGIKEGTGTYTFASGNVYEGSWVNDKRHGQGTMTWYKTDENGEKITDYEYTGSWENGNIQGKGKMTFYDESGSIIDGDTLEGIWENNAFKGEASENEAA